jgi:hypothetical protein
MSSDTKTISKICVTENIRAGEHFKIHLSSGGGSNYLECMLFTIIFGAGYLLKTEAHNIQVLTQNNPHLQYYAVSQTGTIEGKNLHMAVHIVTRHMSRVSFVKELYKSVGSSLEKCKMNIHAVKSAKCLDGITVVEHLVEAYKQSITSGTVEEISPKDYNNGTNSFTNLFQDDGTNSGGKAGIKSIQMEEIRNTFHAGLALQVVENSKKRPIRRPSKRVLEARLDNMKVKMTNMKAKHKEEIRALFKDGKDKIDKANKEIARLNSLVTLGNNGSEQCEYCGPSMPFRMIDGVKTFGLTKEEEDKMQWDLEMQELYAASEAGIERDEDLDLEIFDCTTWNETVVEFIGPFNKPHPTYPFIGPLNRDCSWIKQRAKPRASKKRPLDTDNISVQAQERIKRLKAIDRRLGKKDLRSGM